VTKFSQVLYAEVTDMVENGIWDGKLLIEPAGI
jgi:hypothetical protein